MTSVDSVLASADAALPDSLERLFALLRIPSISTDPAYAGDCARCAEAIVADLSYAFDARVVPTGGHPMVIAHRKPEGATRHVLFYGHYDVQPPDPLALWETPPFEPRLVESKLGGQKIVARGSSDDKGQFMTFLEAARAWMNVEGELPVAVTILLEGEEESGSGSMRPFLDAHRGELTADLALVCDTGQWDVRTPGITTSLRGMVYDEIVVKTASRDLHSGMYGGAALNPIRVLTKLLSLLHDENGHVTVPGFYEGVPELDPAVAAQWATLGFDESEFLGEVGLSEPAGEHGRSVLQQIWARPTCDVNGIVGGYTGVGAKTVIPAEASAKVSFRLVGDQDPQKIRASFRQMMQEHLPGDAKIEFITHGANPALSLPVDLAELQAARRALHAEWGRDPVLSGSGGSIPIVGDFKRELGMDSLMIGFALDDDRIHSPNEKYELSSYHKGIRSWVRILGALG